MTPRSVSSRTRSTGSPTRSASSFPVRRADEVVVGPRSWSIRCASLPAVDPGAPLRTSGRPWHPDQEASEKRDTQRTARPGRGWSRLERHAGRLPCRRVSGAVAERGSGWVRLVGHPGGDRLAHAAASDSILAVGATFALRLIPALLLGIPIGGFVDRHDRRLTLILVNVAVIVPLAWAALVATNGTLAVTQLLLLSLALGVVDTVRGTATQTSRSISSAPAERRMRSRSSTSVCSRPPVSGRSPGAWPSNGSGSRPHSSCRPRWRRWPPSCSCSAAREPGETSGTAPCPSSRVR